MQINEALLKPITETKYLNVDNTHRYRSIIRFFYLQYEKMRYWMYPEEVFEELSSHESFKEYTLEQCQTDLQSLKEWKNLMAMQDTKKVSTIEEFKNKKFRYQLSEYSVEIERMVVRLESLTVEGSSLEPTLLERIRESIAKIEEISKQGEKEIYSWWSDLNNNFVLLNQNYQDYMRDLNSLKAEEMMKTKEFLIFKDKLIEYLRGFVKGLQYNVAMIEGHLTKLEPEWMNSIYEHVLAYELSIPRLDFEVSKDDMMERIKDRFSNVVHWFTGDDKMDAEAETVFELANEIIRKITRYAAQISEQTGGSANRKNDYLKLIDIFYKCDDVEEAHCFSANVFGYDYPSHLKGDFPRDTESINSSVYEESPATVYLVPKSNKRREKGIKSAIKYNTDQKEKIKQATLKRIERERKLQKGYIKDNILDFKYLPVIRPEVRDTFLAWLSKAFENPKRTSRTEDGHQYFVESPENMEYCELECTDGTLRMPAYKIIFEENAENENSYENLYENSFSEDVLSDNGDI